MQDFLVRPAFDGLLVTVSSSLTQRHQVIAASTSLRRYTRTCGLHGVSPLEYLRAVLRRIAEGHPRDRYDELLPSAWTADDG